MIAHLHKPIIIRTRIDREFIDPNHLLHIYNFHRLPEEIQEAMHDFVPGYLDYMKTRPASILLASGNAEEGDVRYYISPKMLTDFCSEFMFEKSSVHFGRPFLISSAPNVKLFLDNINFSCLEPPYMRSNVIATKLANAIASKAAHVSFEEDSILVVCNADKNFRVSDFPKALGLEMIIEASSQGDVDIFHLKADLDERVGLEAIHNAMFRNYGNLLVIPNDQKSLNVINEYYSRGRQPD